MANQATDNRTNVSTGESATGWEDIGGTAAIVDTEVSYDTYTGSLGEYLTTTRAGTFYNNGGTGLFSSGDTAYLLINCGIVALLATKVNGGLTVRVTGATATDWAEFELFGSDEWATAFNGGWVQIVVDIDELLANPTNTNGTPPTVANIQRFGVTGITASVMPRMADNFWVGGFKILPANTPAIIVEGRDSGTTDWNLTSIAAVAAIRLSAVLLPGTGGSFVCRGPIQFGINDTSTHAFLETNKTLIWDDQEVMLDGFYGLSALGNVGGTTNVTFGIKSGTGTDAVGSQGGSIQADSTLARWFMDFNDPNLDGANFYGVQFIHGDQFDLDDAAVSVISSNYIDVTKVIATGSEQLRISVIAPNTADGVAFMDVVDIGDIVNSSFEFSDGHAIEILSGGSATQSSIGNRFSGFGAIGTNDAAIYNNKGAALTISISAPGLTGEHTYRNGASASTVLSQDVSVTLTGLPDNTEVRVYTAGTTTELAGIEDATAGSVDDRSFTFTLSASTIVDIRIHNIFFTHLEIESYTIPAADTTIPIDLSTDRVYLNP